ncbi:MAG: SUMF1/EgtB/PvdO family nonheme iron enzyme [Phycisphaerae bacterium]|jgi:formylglycine-generating enzyme required for sulfatase activity|nr:SUMF1/EgtB/PvdO family nonheme iron enzyme [Phycisphaerae bacterium]
MKKAVHIVCAAVVVAALGSAAMALNIETVPVGNPGNANDAYGAGYGAVDYAYNIGKYEVTAGQYTEFLSAVAATDPYRLYSTNMWSGAYSCMIERSGSPGGYSYSVASDYAKRPVNYVSWGDAARFANWLTNGQPTGTLTGNPIQDAGLTEDGSYDLNGAVSSTALMAIDREDDWKWAIPSEDEWCKAAYYKGGGTDAGYWNYPTSSDTAPGYVNNSGKLSGTVNPFTDGVTDPGNYATHDGDAGMYGIGPDYYRTEVGEWENSDSPYGTFDQGGNVYEWNEAILHDGSRRGFRGGSFASYSSILHASYRNSSGGPLGEVGAVGFRVAQVPEPATFTLLAIGGLALVRRRKRGACE